MRGMNRFWLPGIVGALVMLGGGILAGCNLGVTRDVALGALGGDQDGDGWAPCPSSGGKQPSVLCDCDDRDPNIHPGAAEQCDGKDNDCNGIIDDGSVLFYQDLDGDGHGNAAVSTQASCAPPGFVGSHDDCDDQTAATYPGAAELCDGRDNDCDAVIDDGLESQTVFFADKDGDGFGITTGLLNACALPKGYAPTSGDCDDGDPAIYPGAPDSKVDGQDGNCDGVWDTISTAAGTLPSALDAEPIDATNAYLDAPNGVAVDILGNLYIADTNHNAIRRLDAGVVLTLVGNGEPGFSGDGGPATLAQLDGPTGVVLDGAGNLYIADSYNFRVRKVDQSGTITTVAGNGAIGFNGDGGPATQAQLNNGFGVSVDREGNLYIADVLNNRIRKVDESGTITTIAGNGKHGFSGDGGPATLAQLAWPFGVSFDGEGNLYLADSSNNRIRKVDQSGTITTVAGNGSATYGGDGGPATLAQLKGPLGVSVDGEGNLYIADSDNNRVRNVNQSGTITTVAGNGVRGYSGDGGPATLAQFDGPTGLVPDGEGNLYIADTYNGRIREVNQSGTITTIAGFGGFVGGYVGPATLAQLESPMGVWVDGDDNLYIVDTSHCLIRKVDRNGTITVVAGNGKAASLGDGGPATLASINYPSGVMMDGDGSLYIADTKNNRIRKVDPSGTITTVAGTGVRGFTGDGGPATLAKLYLPSGVAVDLERNFYVADFANNRIRKVDSSGTITTVAGNGAAGFDGDGGPATLARLYYPFGVTVDRKDNLYIADYYNNRIRKVDQIGTITSVVGSGKEGFSGDGGPATLAQLDLPTGVLLGEEGNLYVADYANNRIRMVDGSGAITSVAGSRRPGFSGDGGSATLAQLAGPTGISMDREGNLYISDTDNNRIRKVTP